MLLTPLAHRSTTEIIYRRDRRYGYPMLRERIGRLGTTLRGPGIQRGDTVPMMDWDSHRFLEFAMPMIGAVLEPLDLIRQVFQRAAAARCASVEELLTGLPCWE